MDANEIINTGLLLIVIAYLFGSISSAIIVCRVAGLGDPRDAGSGNPGATNVLRLGGKKAALFTLIGDMLKGTIPVAVALYLQQPHWVVGSTAVAAFLGHLFPIFFRFKGGKGVATFFGVLLVLNWQLGIFAVLCWLICAWSFRISSLSALITAITIPVYSWHFFPQEFYYLLIICALMMIRHHQNIRNIMIGEESRIGAKAN
jgi:glycerol-3-phosphate acyltransferase PlsY